MAATPSDYFADDRHFNQNDVVVQNEVYDDTNEFNHLLARNPIDGQELDEFLSMSNNEDMNNFQFFTNSMDLMPQSASNNFTLSLNDSFSSNASTSDLQSSFMTDEPPLSDSMNSDILVNTDGKMTVLTDTTSSNVLDNETSNVSIIQQSPQQIVIFHSQIANFNPMDLNGSQTNSGEIRILAQPRSEYRPRTEGESRISAHYLRTNDGSEHDRPTIQVPSVWAEESEFNMIEVTLVDIRKKDHPYILFNKTSKQLFSKTHSIVQTTERNILYFRLTDSDFTNGFKSFDIELLKPRQNNFITKKLIQDNQLYKSRLRFTRHFTDAEGNTQKDMMSQTYSTVMAENYGNVSIDNVSPKCGPMNEEILMFINLKGRVTKNDLKIFLTMPNDKWRYDVKTLTVNAAVAYFKLPSCPVSTQGKVQIDVHIHFMGKPIHQCSFYYLSCIDEQLASMKDDSLYDSIQSLSVNNSQESSSSGPVRRLSRRRRT